MDVFLGKWKAGPEDFENVEAFAKAMNQPEMTKDVGKGVEVGFAKDGENYVMTNSQGGVQVLKEILTPDGNIKSTCSTIPDDLVKVTHRIEDGKLKIEGTVAGVETKSVLSLQDGKLVLEVTTNGVSMKTTYSKA